MGSELALPVTALRVEQRARDLSGAILGRV